MKRLSPDPEEQSPLSLSLLLGGVPVTVASGTNHKKETPESESSSFLQNAPKEDPKPSDAATLLATEMNRLSLEERSEVLEDIHGVTKPIEETPDFVAKSLDEMQHEISKITHKPEYELALSMSSRWVNDPKLWLLFLRCDRFDPKLAAQKFMSHLEGKVNLFGAKKVAGPITLSDMSADDITSLKSGCVQLLPTRDRSGRAVVCNLQQYHVYKEAKNMLRAFWYVIMAALEDEESQRNGIVMVCYNVGPFDNDLIDRDLFWNGCRLFEWLPVHVPGMHYCFNDAKIRVVASLIVFGLPHKERSRLRFHDGSHVECQYKLLSFGVPIGYLPITDKGALKTSNHLKWFQRRKHKEALATYANFRGIDLPTNRDVLIGRGKPFRYHPGNEQMHTIMDNYRDEFESRKRGAKANIVEEIVIAIKRSKGRFLKRDPSGWWVEGTNDEAQQKVSHAFRTKRNNEIALRGLGSSAISLDGGKRARIKMDDLVVTAISPMSSTLAYRQPWCLPQI